MTHKSEGLKYVLKKISISSLDQKEKDGVEQEVTLLQSVRHPNIVAYRDSFFSRERDTLDASFRSEHLCILMEYCDSGDLYTYLQKGRKGEVIEASQEGLILTWFIQIATAVAFLHDRSILHRDLKTQNIFLTGYSTKFIKDANENNSLLTLGL